MNEITDTVLTTETSDEATNKDSALFGVSVRAWLALIIIVTVCANSTLITLSVIKAGGDAIIAEPLYTISALAIGFYFGQKKS